MKRFQIVFLVGSILILVAASDAASQTTSNTAQQTAWIASVIKDVQKIKVGMTRGDLRKVFGEEGGLSTTGQRTYVYLGCPYIKVDFEFESRGREIKDTKGQYLRPESDLDVIKKMSKAYLAFSIID